MLSSLPSNKTLDYNLCSCTSPASKHEGEVEGSLLTARGCTRDKSLYIQNCKGWPKVWLLHPFYEHIILSHDVISTCEKSISSRVISLQYSSGPIWSFVYCRCAKIELQVHVLLSYCQPRCCYCLWMRN